MEDGGGWKIRNVGLATTSTASVSGSRQPQPSAPVHPPLSAPPTSPPHGGRSPRPRGEGEDGDHGARATKHGQSEIPHRTGLICTSYPLGRATRPRSISLLVGEMPGRAEGGIARQKSKRSSESFAVTNEREGIEGIARPERCIAGSEESRQSKGGIAGRTPVPVKPCSAWQTFP
ncbi:hypothetical protein RHI9324_02152 [Rhizobium sp. CECT 9324]|nr:hypothetical protein RHI9324_02152 [Rhizobium sp. CECT 9324]